MSMKSRDMSINFTYSFDLASAFIIGLILGLLLRQCEPEPRQEARRATPESLEVLEGGKGRKSA